MIFLISGVSLWYYVTGDIDLAIKKNNNNKCQKLKATYICRVYIYMSTYICRVHTKRRGGFIKMIVLGYEKILIARN